MFGTSLSELTKAYGIYTYKVNIVEKYHKGKISYEKAQRLFDKVQQWINVAAKR